MVPPMTELEHDALDASFLGLVYASEKSIDRLLLRSLRLNILRTLHRAVHMGCFRVDEKSCRDAWLRPGTAKYNLTSVSSAAR